MALEKELYQACFNNQAAAVQAFLEKSKLDVNWGNPDYSMNTALHIASREGHTEIVELLLKHAAIEVNRLSNQGCTPFILACINGRLDVIRMLLKDPRVDVNLPDKLDRTPLWEAVNHWHLGSVKMLVASGRPLDTARTGRATAESPPLTVFELAKEKGRAELIAFLEDFKQNSMHCRVKVRRELGMQDSHIERLLGIPLPLCGWVLPDKCVSMHPNYDQATTLRLPSHCLSKLNEHFLIFTHLEELDLCNNPLDPSNGPILAKLITSNNSLKTLRLHGTALGPIGLLPVFQALVLKFFQKNFSLETITVDDEKLRSYEGLGTIPVDIIHQGTKATAQYLLDLFRSPDAAPLYKTKIMVVGLESVGKTTALDCIFPLCGYLDTKGKVKKTRYLVKLQGKVLLKLKDPHTPHKLLGVLDQRYDIQSEGKVIKISLKSTRTSMDQARSDSPGPGEAESIIYFQSKEICDAWFAHLNQPDGPWKVRKVSELSISAKPGTAKAYAPIDIHFPDEQTHATWLARFRRLCKNEATHGIEIQNIIADHPLVSKYFADKQGHLEVSVWDFAGQSEYYNSHHYFLSSRTVFLILWRLTEHQKGIEGLEFWLKSLAAHLGKPVGESPSDIYSTVVVVGTFLDDPSVFKIKKNERETEVLALAKDCGLMGDVKYAEVSCETLENIDTLQETIYSSALSHAYMGEQIPKGYQAISDYIMKARLTHDLPIMDFNDLQVGFGNVEFIQRALKLLSLWGDCVYFEEPPALAKTVVLDPKFLTKEVLAQFFKPSNVPIFKGGIVRHSDFQHVFPRYKSLADPASVIQTLFLLMEKFEVCFLLDEDKAKSFLEQSSIVPALLPEKNAKEDPKTLSELKEELGTDMRRFTYIWPRDPPHDRPIQFERALCFNVIPIELVSRLLVRLHSFIQNKLVWRDEVVILNTATNTQAWIRVSVAENSFCVSLRGTSVETCLAFMNFIISQVAAACRGCGGVKWYEAVRSPLSTTALIPHEVVVAESRKSADERTLVCPETHFPLYAEWLLKSGGYMDFKIPYVPSWWEKDFEGSDSTLAVPIFENGAAKESPFAAHLSGILSKMQCNPREITEAFVINNPVLRTTLLTTHLSLEGKLTDTKSLFRKQHWKLAPENSLRRKILHHLGDYVGRFRSREWNNGERLPIIPVIQMIPEKMAWMVAKYGFGIMPACDQGLYGQGLYFSTSAQYVSIQTAREANVDGYVYLVSLMTPGNSYPVIEGPDNKPLPSLRGRGILPGYQSHYAVVSTESGSFGLPVKQFDDKCSPVGELALADPSQVMPLFIFKTSSMTSPATPSGPIRKEWKLAMDSMWRDIRGSAENDLSKSISAVLQEVINEASKQNAQGLLDRYQAFSNLTREFVSETTQRNLDMHLSQERQSHVSLISHHVKTVQESVKAIKKGIEQGTPAGDAINTLVQTRTGLRHAMQALLGLFLPANIVSPFATPGATKWWRTDINGPNQLIRIYGNNQIINQSFVDKLITLFPPLGKNLQLLHEVYWIHNPRLATLFEATVDSIAMRQQVNPTAFKKDDWKQAPDASVKQGYLNYLENLKTPLMEVWNGHQPVHLITMMQGTSQERALRIAENGFGTVASLDSGWYGQGIYLTSQVSYANMYSTKAPNSCRVFIVSLVVPGNVFPVTEPPFKEERVPVGDSLVTVKVPNPDGYLGKPCRPGYQSHFSVVERQTKGFGQPVPGKPGFAVNDELVVFEPSQALPLFMVYSDKLGNNTKVTAENYQYGTVQLAPKNVTFFG